jgi:putative protease
MFNGIPQSAAKLVPELLGRGVQTFRIEGLFESAETLRAKIEAYLAVLNGTISPFELQEKLGLVERYGVTDGQLYNIGGYRDRKKPFVPVREMRGSGDPGLERIMQEASDS